MSGVRATSTSAPSGRHAMEPGRRCRSAALLPRRLGRQKCIFSQLKRFFFFLFFAAMRTARGGVYFYFCGYTRGDIFFLLAHIRAGICFLCLCVRGEKFICCFLFSTVLLAGSRWRAKTVVAVHALFFARKKGLG